MTTMDMSQYLDVFLDEGREQLALLESHVLQMERGDHSEETIQVIFRAAHTLKGSSRAMGFLAVGDLTHEMENVLDDLRQGVLAVGTPIIDALLDCLDALTALIESVANTGTDAQAEGKDTPALVARLEKLRSGHGVPANGTAKVSAAPAPLQGVSSATEAQSASLSSASFPLTDYEQASIDDAQASGLTVYQIQIVLSADCLMKSVRVFMVLGALEPLGAVLIADPKEEKLEEEEFDQAFQLLFVGERPQSEIEKALDEISEIDSVVVTPWEKPQVEAQADAPIPEPEKEITAPPPEPTPPAAAPPAAKTAAAPDPALKNAASHVQTIRVDVARLDSLLNLIGELVIDRTQIARIGSELQSRYPHEEHVTQLVEATSRVARITSELQDEIMKTRMLPVDGVFQRMPRMVRDLAQKTGKDLDFQMSGGETELDRSVLESLGDPLIHLLRNSVDHGIETPSERVAAGKPSQGRVTLAARYEENNIVIEITDDGGGIDPVKIKAAAIKKGLITPAEADAMSERDAVHLIFAAGFSTAATLSDISGRGVGMDIVRSNLEKLGGRVHVDSRVGQGSRFTVYLPLTLAIVRALLIQSGGGTYVLPLGSVVEMLRLGSGEGGMIRRSVGGQAMIVLRGRTLPLANLSDVLCGDPAATRTDRIAETAYVVVVGWGERQVGLCVDGLIGEQEVVIKSLGTLLGDTPGLSGATILGDGRVALIVDPAKAIQCLGALTGEKA
jgi:two-component system chemotaxis sensor kinase CheA